MTFLFESLKRIEADPSFFQPVFIFGAGGIGKTHFLSAMQEELRASGLPDEKLTIRELDDYLPAAGDDVGEIVAAYESQKTRGGFFLLSSRFPPDRFSENPHVASRVQSGAVFELRAPGIDELRPTLLSLLERRNLRITERAVDYVLRRAPTNPLSLWGVLAKIDDRALRQGRAVGLNFIREILGEL